MKNIFTAIAVVVFILFNVTLACMDKMDYNLNNIVFMIGMWVIMLIGFKALFMVANSRAAKREMRKGRR